MGEIVYWCRLNFFLSLSKRHKCPHPNLPLLLQKLHVNSRLISMARMISSCRAHFFAYFHLIISLPEKNVAVLVVIFSYLSRVLRELLYLFFSFDSESFRSKSFFSPNFFCLVISHNVSSLLSQCNYIFFSVIQFKLLTYPREVV